MKRTHIFVRNPDGTSDYEIEAFSSLTLNLIYNSVSKWTITCPVTPASLELALPGNGVIIQGDGFTLSGPTTARDRLLSPPSSSAGVSGSTSDSSGSDHIVISGVSDDTYLWERICYPCLPTQQGDGSYLFADASNDVRTGACETIMYQFAMANAGGGDWSSGPFSVRQVPGLSFAADEGRGSSVTGSPRFDVLGDFLSQLAIAGGGLSFGVTNMQMWIGQPTNKSDDVEFSTSAGSVVGFEYQTTGPTVTDVVCAGQDVGTARVCVIGGDETAASQWRRIESFVDSRDTADLPTLQQNLSNAITNGAATAKLSVTPRQLDTFRYGYDYQLGDIVSYSIDGTEGQDVLRQVNITLDQNGFLIAPVIENSSTLGPTSAVAIFNTIKAMQQRLALLERAQ